MVFGRIAITPYTSSPSARLDAVRRIYKRANQKDGLDEKCHRMVMQPMSHQYHSKREEK